MIQCQKPKQSKLRTISVIDFIFEAVQLVLQLFQGYLIYLNEQILKSNCKEHEHEIALLLVEHMGVVEVPAAGIWVPRLLPLCHYLNPAMININECFIAFKSQLEISVKLLSC